MAVAQLDSAAGTNGGLRPVVWPGGTAKPIPLPMTPDDCALRFNHLVPPFSQESFNVYPMGLNRVGHILIYACNTQVGRADDRTLIDELECGVARGVEAQDRDDEAEREAREIGNAQLAGPR